MTKTIKIRNSWTEFTLAVADKVIIETPCRDYGEIPMPSRRQVAKVERILGGENHPYVEVSYSDPNSPPGVVILAKFNSRGRLYAHKDNSLDMAMAPTLRPWVSDEHEAAHKAAQREARRLNAIAGEITATFSGRRAWELLAQRPNLAAVFETLLTTVTVK